jgi:hypothetical protein
MDVERTMEFILEQQAHMAAQQAAEKVKHDIAMAEMRENQIQLQKFQLAQESAHSIMQQALAKAMYHLVENLDKLTKDVNLFVNKTDERLAKVERDVDGLQGRN